MKKVLLTTSILLASFGCFSQTINGYPMDSLKSPHLLIVGTGKFLSNKVKIEIDFGQENSIWRNDDLKLVKADGTKLEFNSMIDALNFLTKYNYEFVDAYVITVPTALGGAQNVYHWLLRKK